MSPRSLCTFVVALLSSVLVSSCIEDFYDGVWQGRATADHVDVGGTVCTPPELLWEVTNGTITNAAASENIPLGTVGWYAGEVTARGREGTVTFAGDLEGGPRFDDNVGWIGSGTWKAASGCTGTWTIQRVWNKYM